MKLLHLVIDDKFTYAARDNFDKFDAVDNDWLVVSSSKFTYLKLCDFEQISLRGTTLPGFKDSLGQSDFIIVHSLLREHCDFINNNPHHTYVWIGMGFDYYEYIDSDIFLPFSKRNQLFSSPLKSIDHFLGTYLKFKLSTAEKRRKAIGCISFFAPVLPGEFTGVYSVFKHLEYIEWNYGTSSSIIDESLVLNDDANSILIGNSSDPSNNHYEVVDMLSSLNLVDREIILPLSYGSPAYKKRLLKKLKAFDNLTFNVLEGFMPKNEYFNLLSGCDVVIMNHVRQQAGANIGVMLYMGAKVFLNSKSPFHEFYKSKGAVIYTIEDIEKDSSILYRKLDDESVQVNRDVVSSTASRENTDRKTKSLIQTLMDYQSA
jgi:hypothetical protein